MVKRKLLVMSMLERLKEYFDNTPREEIEKAWEQVKKECEGVDSPTVDEFLKLHGYEAKR